MRVQLSDHFTSGKLLRFTLPSIAMMVFTSVYSMVDGFFVSNYVGKIPFAAVNLVSPIFPIVGSLGMMLGTGGTAIVGTALGQKKEKEANAYFSMFVYSIIILGIFIGFIGILSADPLMKMLGAEDEMLSYGVLYSKVLFFASPFFLLQFGMQSFFVMAEKPRLGFLVTVLGGMLNMLLDPLLIIVFHQGLAGAALATAVSQFAAAAAAMLYFARPNDSLLHLTLKTRCYGKIMLKACANGMSEMVDNIAYSLVAILYNFQLMKYYGEDGVAAYGVLMYLGWIFSAIHYGYAMGVSPIFSYQYGAGNHEELQNLFQMSIKIVAFMGVSMLCCSELFAAPLSKVFVGYDKALNDLTVHATRLYFISFLFSGFSVFGSAFFTALNDGMVSALISFLRTLVFEIGSILILPVLLGNDGIWLSVVVAEIAALILTIIFIRANGKKYGYIKET